jgi:hypothetical protein
MGHVNMSPFGQVRPVEKAQVLYVKKSQLQVAGSLELE